jgi:hypothetical protein
MLGGFKSEDINLAAMYEVPMELTKAIYDFASLIDMFKNKRQI